MVFEEIILSSTVITHLYFISAYAILGGGIKFIDDAFDENIYNKMHAILLAPLLGVFWAYTMSLSAASATILMAIVLGVLLKGKIDNIAHKAGLVSIIGVVIFSGFFNFLIIPLVVLTIFAIIDEIGNDYVSNDDIYTKGVIGKILHYFFEYRFAMKFAVLFFVLFGTFEVVYLFAFLAFDVAYASVMLYTNTITHIRKFYYHQSNNVKGVFNGKK